MRDRRNQRDWWFAFVLLALPPLLMGGATLGSLLILAVIAATALSAMVVRGRHRLEILELDVGLLLLLAWTLAPLIPLPIEGSTEAVRGRALGAVGGWAPYSLDPGGTLQAGLLGATAVCVYFACRLGGRRVGRSALLHAVAASVALLALVALMHEFTGARKVFGLYTPVETGPTLLSPVLNPNHLGGVTAFGAALWLGISLTSKDERQRFIAVSATCLCAFTALGSGSRSGVASLGLGLLMVVFLRFVRRGDEGITTSSRTWLFVGIVGSAAMVAFAVFDLSALFLDFTQGDYSKVGLVRRSFEGSFDHPLLGTGRGTFEAAFASHGTSETRFTHPENILVQWAFEWGWPVTFVFAGVLIRTGRKALNESFLLGVAVIGLVALVVHDLADFALELPGVLLLATATLAAVATPPRPTTKRTKRGASRRKWGRPALLVPAAIAVLLVPVVWLTDSRRLMEEMGREGPTPAGVAAWSHPALPQVVLAVGASLRRKGEPSALRWLNHAMNLAPEWSAPHTEAAWMLGAEGAVEQALLEAREAEQRRPGSADELLCWLAPQIESQRLVGTLLGRLEAPGIDRMAAALARCLGAESATFDELILQQVDEGQLAAGAFARRSARRRQAGDVEGALGDARRTVLEDRSLQQHLEYSMLVSATESPAAALCYLNQIRPLQQEGLQVRRTERWAYLETKLSLLAMTEDVSGFDESAAEMRRIAAGSARDLAAAWVAVGNARLGAGDAVGSLSDFGRAVELEPNNRSHANRLVRAAQRAGVQLP